MTFPPRRSTPPPNFHILVEDLTRKYWRTMRELESNTINLLQNTPNFKQNTTNFKQNTTNITNFKQNTPNFKQNTTNITNFKQKYSAMPLILADNRHQVRVENTH